MEEKKSSFSYKKTLFQASFFFFLSAATSVYAGSIDQQYWQIESFSYKVNDKWKLILVEEVYFRDDASDYYHEHTEIGADYSGFCKWLDVGLHYRHSLEENNRSVWKREEQPSLNLTLKFKVKDYSITDRNRFEYRIKEDATDSWRYRNQTTIRFPWKWTRFEIQPYFSDEFYIDFLKQELSENRMYTGVSLKFNKYLGCDIFYMWRRIKSSDVWATNNVFGTNIKVLF